MPCVSTAAAGAAEWKGVLADFWGPLDEAVQGGLQLSVVEVIDHLDAVLEPMLFPVQVPAPAVILQEYSYTATMCGERLLNPT